MGRVGRGCAGVWRRHLPGRHAVVAHRPVLPPARVAHRRCRHDGGHQRYADGTAGRHGAGLPMLVFQGVHKGYGIFQYDLQHIEQGGEFDSTALKLE